MRGSIRRLFENFNYYGKISKVEDVARRYFVMNAFDGTLTMLGIIFGSYFAVGVQPRFVVSAGLGAIIAMTISGFGGTFMTETAERKRKLKKIEKRLLRKLKGTQREKAAFFASVYAAIVNGVSPALAALICVFPYILALWGIFSGVLVFYLSLGISTLVLFSLGLYLGKLSKENALLLGIKMLIVGLAVGIVSFLLEFMIK
jgi:predicted membrane protein (TIGR00267 family)